MQCQSQSTKTGIIFYLAMSMKPKIFAFGKISLLMTSNGWQVSGRAAWQHLYYYIIELVL